MCYYGHALRAKVLGAHHHPFHGNVHAPTESLTEVIGGIHYESSETKTEDNNMKTTTKMNKMDCKLIVKHWSKKILTLIFMVTLV
jgi:hypothetical protein